MNRLPENVIREMENVMEEMELFVSPPPNAFSINDCYQIYLKECEERGIDPSQRIKKDALRKRLDREVDNGRYQARNFNVEGTTVKFYWIPDEE